MTKEIHYSKEKDIAVLSLDAADKSINTLSADTLTEMSFYLDKIKKDKTIKAVLLISGKKDNFIVGADINAFLDMSEKSAIMLSKHAQKLLDKIADSPKPFIAAINGACLGGGLEVALACHFRIASIDHKTLFGFPEVNLGLLPAAGGTQRLPRLVGVTKALPLLLSGKRINANNAKSMGLIDAVVRTAEELRPSALGFIKNVAMKKRREHPKIHLWSLLPIHFAQKMIQKKTHGHYPAPFAIIDAVKTGILYGFDEGLKKEQRDFGRLMQTEVSKNLIKLFFAQKSHSKDISSSSKDYTLGIVGSGLMGSGIATVSLVNKSRVLLSDNNKDAISRAKKHIYCEFNKRIKKGRISHLEGERFLSNLRVTNNLDDLSKCSAIIEAIFEDLTVKQELLKKLEPVMNKDCIFASNTSSIPIAEIAEHSSIKDRVIGMHYFSPVEKMPLLEIIKTPQTSKETIDKALSLGSLQKKTIIVVNDSPGFYTTRIVAALFDEACLLLLDGVGIKEIDNKLIKLGFPMGPLALIDQVGIDVGYHVSEILYQRLGTRIISANLHMWKELLDNNFLGKKTGIGFYIYNHKKKINPKITDIIAPYKEQNMKKTSRPQQIEERLLLRMVNEAALCLKENVIESEEDGDIGAVFGLGFPPYLGGPFSYINAQGEKTIAKKLEEMTKLFGDRFHKSW